MRQWWLHNDLGFKSLKALFILGILFTFGILLYGQMQYNKQNAMPQVACYIDSNAFKINTYMLYGKVKADTVYDCKPIYLLTKN